MTLDAARQRRNSSRSAASLAQRITQMHHPTGQHMTKVLRSSAGFSPRAVTTFAFATVLLAVPFGAASAQTFGYAPMQPQAYPQDQGYSQGYPRDTRRLLPRLTSTRRRRRPTRMPSCPTVCASRSSASTGASRPAPSSSIPTTPISTTCSARAGAIRYGVGVGRDGFTWSGVQSVSRKAEWPDWHPPAEMIARQPYLPRFVAGGPGNPLGARAMYLGSSEYRIHGTNDPTHDRQVRLVRLHPHDQ